MNKVKILFLSLSLALYSSLTSAACPFVYSPYHEVTVNMSNSTPLDLVKVSSSTGIKSFTLAFIIDAGTCKAAWDGQYTVASGWGSDLTNRMRAAGIQYIISFGGAAGNDISKACSQASLQTIFQQIINTYQPTGLDFDIENGTANVARIIGALKNIQTNNPSVKLSFTLPVMPNGLDSGGKSVVTQAKTAGLNFIVNVMAMDYGSSYTGNMGTYATQAATATFNYLKTLYPQKTTDQLWQMVGVTVMIGVNDVTSEKFTLANTDTLRDFAVQNKLALLSNWSLDRDKPCGGSTPVENCSSGNVQTTAYQFAKEFLLCGSTPPPPPPPTGSNCLPPSNITTKVSTDKKTITISWQAPLNSLPIANYQVSDYLNQVLWRGTSLSYSDSTLPGTAGTFDYFLYSNCTSVMSKGVKVSVVIN